MPPLPPALRAPAAAGAVVVFAMLLGTLVLGIAPYFSGQVVSLGEQLWPGYGAEIRKQPVQPDCDLERANARAAFCEGVEAPPDAADPGAPSDAPTDPFAEEQPAAPTDPFAEEQPAAPTDPFAEEQPAAPTDPFAEEQPAAPTDPFAEEQPAAEAPPTAQECPAVVAFRTTCAQRWADYDQQIAKQNPTNLLFRDVDVAIGDLAGFPYWAHALTLLVLVGGLTTTARRAHIALRDPATLSEHRAQQLSQLVAFLLLAASGYAHYRVGASNADTAQALAVPLLWTAGFLGLAGVNLVHLASPPELPATGSKLSRLLLVVPLFAYMSIGSGLYFLIAEQHPSALAIYLDKFLQTPSVYMGIGLYIWVGMLFSITRVATLTFGLFRPWGLPHDLLGWLVIALAALPTAYSGASGIFVLAAGAVIFRELTRVGATSRQALTATAMSGSLGVVLAPCLVVLLIAMLNTEVTSSELYAAGLYVFALSAALTLVAMYVSGRGSEDPTRATTFASVAVGVGGLFWIVLFPTGDMLTANVSYWLGEGRQLSLVEALGMRALGMLAVAAGLFGYQRAHGSVSEALAGMRSPAAALLPFVLITGAVVLFYRLVFATDLSEHTAMLVLPTVLLAIVLYDRRYAAKELDGVGLPHPEERLYPLLVEVTAESAAHIGALLALMTASVALGGVVERSGVMEAMPSTLGGLYPTMGILVVAMVIVGMTMDALGAVVLVSASIAGIAYRAGINPVHFWMVVLVAFELGYLSPPVALNHLLARQAIGPASHVELDEVEGFWARNEHVLLPVLVMGTTLLLVAFVPLVLWY